MAELAACTLDECLIAELNGAVSLDPLPLLRSYTWGIDLSGSEPDGEQDAGGIGGLLMFTEYTSSTAYHFYQYDGNGNITGLVKSDGNVSARYEYGPFHDLIVRSGSVSEINPFLSSSKFRVRDLNLAYYGKRWLSLPLARWMNRDPIEEEGGLNLYAFVGNNPLNAFDLMGAASSTAEQGTAGEVASTSESNAAASVGRTSNFIKDKLDLLQDLDDIRDAIMSMDDPAEALLQVQDLASQMLSAKRSGSLGSGHRHHLTPQALKSLQPHLKGEIDKFTVALDERLHRRLHSGRGFGRGGIWNGLWNQFVANKGKKINKDDMKAFMGQMQRLFGLGDLPVKPYKR